MSVFINPLTFSQDTPNKISEKITVVGTNSLIKKDDGWRVAIADQRIDPTDESKFIFCIRVDREGFAYVGHAHIMCGFTPLESFDSSKQACFGLSFGFPGVGLCLSNGAVHLTVRATNEEIDSQKENPQVIDKELSKHAKEVVVILETGNYGLKKDICFLCDGNESKSTDVAKFLRENQLFPAISLFFKTQQVTAIPIDQIKKSRRIHFTKFLNSRTFCFNNTKFKSEQ
jgi:hypothetical protein